MCLAFFKPRRIKKKQIIKGRKNLNRLTYDDDILIEEQQHQKNILKQDKHDDNGQDPNLTTVTSPLLKQAFNTNQIHQKTISLPSQSKISSILSMTDREYKIEQQQNQTFENLQVTLTSPPQLMRGYPKPLHYYNRHKNKHYIVMTTSYHHFNEEIEQQNELKNDSNNLQTHHQSQQQNYNNFGGCVYMYDIEEDKYINFSSYPSNLKPENHGHCIDVDSDLLYIFFGRHRVFATLNLLTGLVAFYFCHI